MHKKNIAAILLYIATVLLLSGCTNTSINQSNISDLNGQGISLEAAIDATSPAVVVLQTDSGQGSGVLLSSTGMIITNLHVLEGAKDIQVDLQSGGVFDDVRILGFDTKRDLALIKVDGRGLPHITLDLKTEIKRGKTVFAIGAPRGLEQTVSQGIVSAIRTEDGDNELIQTDAAISPGSSGGGLFNDEGQFLGVIVSYRADGQNLNFAIPAKYIQPLLDNPVSYSEEEFFSLNIKTSLQPKSMNVSSPREKLEGWLRRISSEYSVEYRFFEESQLFVLLISEDIYFIFQTYDDLLLLYSEIVDNSSFSSDERSFIHKSSKLANYSYFVIEDGALDLYAELPLIGTEYEAFEAVVLGANDAYIEMMKQEFIQRKRKEQEFSETSSDEDDRDVRRPPEQNEPQEQSIYTSVLPEIRPNESFSNMRSFTPKNQPWELFYDGFSWKESIEQGEEASNIQLNHRANKGYGKVFFEKFEGVYDPEILIPMIVDEYLLSLNDEPTLQNLEVLDRGRRVVNGRPAAWARFRAIVQGLEVSYQSTFFYSNETLFSVHTWRMGTKDSEWTINENVTQEILSNIRYAGP